MPPIPTPVLIIAAIVQSQSTVMKNISYWQPVTPPATFTDMNNICTDFNTLFKAPYAACINGDSKYVGCTAEYKAGSTLLEGVNGVVLGGGAAGFSVSDQNAVVIRKATSLGGRQNIGRYFIGALAGSAFDPSSPDEISPAVVADFQAVAALYGADQTFNGIVTHARHWDRKDNVLRVITGCFVSSRIATRRDRRRHSADIPL